MEMIQKGLFRKNYREIKNIKIQKNLKSEIWNLSTNLKVLHKSEYFPQIRNFPPNPKFFWKLIFFKKLDFCFWKSEIVYIYFYYYVYL